MNNKQELGRSEGRISEILKSLCQAEAHYLGLKHLVNSHCEYIEFLKTQLKIEKDYSQTLLKKS